MTKNTFSLFKPSANRIHRIFQNLNDRYPEGKDPWGFDLKKCQTYVEWFWPLYSTYFKVRIHGQHHVQDRPYMVVANHTGQLPFDGLLIYLAFLMEINPPRILRGMVERFLAGLPFLGEMAAQAGLVLGDRQNCLYLLEQGESILVFPEGVKGIAKNTPDFYQLQEFTKGFFRLALQTQTEVLPIAVVGAEEMYPYVWHAKKLAKLFGFPALPLTPFFPLLGPMGMLPLPSPIDIYIGEPYKIPQGISPEAPDKVLQSHVSEIEKIIAEMIKQGRSKQRSFWNSNSSQEESQASDSPTSSPKSSMKEKSSEISQRHKKNRKSKKEIHAESEEVKREEVYE